MRTFTYTNIAIDEQDFDSTSLDFIYYDRHTSTLGVEFQSGETIYGYRNVPESVYNMFVAADSVGAFYTRNIKDRFDGDGTYENAVKRLLPESALVPATDHSDENAWEEQEPPLADWERELLAGVEESETISSDDNYSQYVVNWTGSFENADERMGPFSYAVEAESEKAAVDSFWSVARRLHGNSITAKIVSVTRYFE